MLYGCTIPGKCKCDLSANANQIDHKEIIVGAVDSKLSMPLTIRNIGTEPAFDAKVIFEFTIQFIKPPANCKTIELKAQKQKVRENTIHFK